MTPFTSSAPFNSAHGRAVIVKVLLALSAIAAGISLLAEALSLAFPPLTEEQELTDNPVAIVLALVIFLNAILETLLYLTTVIFFAMWLYRTYDNLRAFDRSRPLDHSPGWAVGSFFVPFVNLVVPYRAVREAWQKSGPADEALLAEPSPPAWFPVWWAFWLLATFANNISLRISFNENISVRTATVISLIASALFMVAALLAFLVVDAIDKRQEATSATLRLGDFSAPPPPPSIDLSRPPDVAY